MKNATIPADSTAANLINAPEVCDTDKEAILEKKATFWVTLLKVVVGLGSTVVSIFSKK